MHSALTERLTVRGRELMDMGILEQDLVFGAASAKEVITFVGRPGFSPAEKVQPTMRAGDQGYHQGRQLETKLGRPEEGAARDDI